METPAAGQNIITRGLPKTGQVIQYQPGDDGTYEAGWWKGRLNANNRTRFIAKTIGGDDVVVDRATGLMWAADGAAGGCNNGNITIWINAVNIAQGLDFAGFDDWRLPNIMELPSLLEYSQVTGKIHPVFFPNTVENAYWSSTSAGLGFGSAWCVNFSTGETTYELKTESYYMRGVRGGI